VEFLGNGERFSWNPVHDNFAPRLGIAFKITEKLVLRTGYGIFFPTVTGTGDLVGFLVHDAVGHSVRAATASIRRTFSRNPYPTV
jgi:hypothetical protein